MSDANELTPVTIRGKAVVETTVGSATTLIEGAGNRGARAENRRFGIETEVGGLMSPGTGASRLDR